MEETKEYDNNSTDMDVEVDMDIETLQYNNHEYYSGFSSDSGDGSISSEIHRQRKNLNEYKRSDPGYNMITNYVNGEKVKIEFYETPYTPGNNIRNAVTGVRQRGYYVGSADENLFFKVTDVRAMNHNKEPKILFYDDTEQWEMHFGVKCPPEMRSKWLQKLLDEKSRRQLKDNLRAARAAVEVK